MTTVNSLTVFLLIGNLQIEITADFWENLGIQYWSIESDYCVQHSLSERAIYSTLDASQDQDDTWSEPLQRSERSPDTGR